MSDTITNERRQVAGVSVTFFEVLEDLAGNKSQIVQTAARGEFVELHPREAARLDKLGMLVPPGREVEGTPAQVRANAERAIADNAKAIIERGVNPLDVAFPPSTETPAPSVSPPPSGAAPSGDLTTGDTGIEPTMPVDSGLPVAPAEPPDAAIAEVGEISAFIEAEQPNAADTVALAKGDPALAVKVLEAEKTATGGDPRKSVEGPLQKIIDQGARA